VKRIYYDEFLVVLEDPYIVEAAQNVSFCDFKPIAQRYIPRFDNLPATNDIRSPEIQLLGNSNIGYDKKKYADELYSFHNYVLWRK
jgi:predicted nucleotide-binding protein (sugar kinase/HSP70/actin superfamily)